MKPSCFGRKKSVSLIIYFFFCSVLLTLIEEKQSSHNMVKFVGTMFE